MAKRPETIKTADEIPASIINDPNDGVPEMDSKYRMIIVAAQRSKQLQRGSRPRVELDNQKHKHTRIAVMEVRQGKVNFEIIKKS